MTGFSLDLNIELEFELAFIFNFRECSVTPPPTPHKPSLLEICFRYVPSFDSRNRPQYHFPNLVPCHLPPTFHEMKMEPCFSLCFIMTVYLRISYLRPTWLALNKISFADLRSLSLLRKMTYQIATFLVSSNSKYFDF